ncbi:MAG: hypothetical protein RR523_12940 [Cetobacterium sp.]|uniref:hypothetical protein n=1 Tax=Cetobacterium sp. TaxID=2071632 RepID=UPI002FC93BDA
MTGLYLIPNVNKIEDNYNKCILGKFDEVLKECINEKFTQDINKILDQEITNNWGLWGFRGNKGSNNFSYWKDIRKNDIVLFFNNREKLVGFGRMVERLSDKFEPDQAMEIFADEELILGFLLKDLVVFEESNIYLKRVGDIIGYEDYFRRGVVRVSDRNFKNNDIIGKLYEEILFNTSGERLVGSDYKK